MPELDLMPSTVDFATVEAMADDFATRAERHDRDASFPYENVDTMTRAGIYRLMVPQHLGGAGGDLAFTARVLRRIAQGDGSSALIVIQNMAVVAAFSVEAKRGDARMERFLREEVAQNKRIALFAGAPEFERRGSVLATRVDGGFLLNGAKGFGTGCLAADWGCTPVTWLKSEEERVGLRVIYPMSSPGITIGDNWDTFGMRGSNSHDFWFEDTFVPDDNVLRQAPEVPGGPPDALTINFFFPGFALFASMYLGIADAAFAYVKQALAERMPLGGTTPAIMNPGLQSFLGEIDQRLREADAYLNWICQKYSDSALWTPANLTDVVSMKDSVTRKAVEIVEMCMQALGGPAYYKRCPLERLYRDVRAGPIHPPNHPAAMSQLGGAIARSVTAPR